MPKSSSSPAHRRARLARLRDGRLSALEAKIPNRRIGLGKVRSPIAARAGGQTVGGALPGGRITRGVGVVVLLALVGLGVRGLVGQKLDIAGQIERAARAKYIPQLEKQLGQKVEVGEFSTDLLGRVTVSDVVIGRNPALPTGALLRAKSLTIGLDVIGAALGRVKPLDAVNRVQIQSPQVYLERQPDGKFNLESLLPPKKKGEPKTVWTGTVVVNDGRVFYFDRALPSRSGRQLKLDLRGIEATVNANGEDPYRGQVTIAQTRLPDGSVARNISAEATLGLKPNRGWINAKFPKLPATVLADYALPKGEAIARRGSVSGRVRVALDGNTVTPTGDLTLSNIGLVTTKAREPLNGRANAGPPIAIDDLNGDLRFANRAIQSDGLRARALGASWTARGSASLQDVKSPLFDVQIATPNLPVGRVQSWAKAGAIPVNWQSGNVGLSARISGAPDNARASGAVNAPNVRVRSTGLKNAIFDATAPRLKAAFVAQYRKDEPVKFAVRAQLPRISGNGKSSGYAGAGELNEVEITARGGSGPSSPLAISARAARWKATSPRYGTTNGRALNLVASTKALGNPAFTGKLSAREITTNGINKGAFSPEAARLVRELGTANASVTFADVGADFKRARVTADVDLSRVSLSRAALPIEFRDSLPASALMLNNLRARVGLRDGKIVVPGASASGGFGGLRVAGGGTLANGQVAGGGFAVELPDIRLTAAQINPFLRARGVAVSGDWRGRVAVVGSDAKSFEATFALQSNAVTVRDRRSRTAGLRLDGPSIRGQVRVQGGGLYRGEAVVAAREVTARGGSLGPQFAIPVQLAGARAVGLRINANFSARKWAARLDVTRAAVPVPGAIATVDDTSVLAQSDGDIVRLTRLSAGFAGGRFDGTGKLERGKVTAKVLAREVEAGALQRLLAAKSLGQARLQGQVSALVSIENGGDPYVEAQLAGGKVTIVKSGLVVPLDVAKARLIVAGKTATVRGATLWSDGARFSGSGQIDLSGAGQGALPAANGTLKVDALRLANWATRLEQLGVVGLQKQGWKQAALDGILSGDFRLTGGATPRVEGEIELRAGTAFGSDIQSASANVAAVQSGGGVRLAVSELSGRIEGAPFEGQLALDTVGNTWRARLKTADLDAGRAARLRALSARTDDSAKISLLPIEGNLSADIDVAGILKPNAGEKQPFFVPRSGYARLVAGDVAWQGRPVGTLRANLEIANDLARIQTLELVPTKSGLNDVPTPRLTASGTIPLSPDAPGLDVQFEVAEAPLQFFVDATRDAREALAGTGVTQTALDQIVGYADALPPGTRGDVAMKAAIGGTLRRPTISVPLLTLRDGRTPLPYGGFSPPATLDVAFSYGNGIATVSKGEFRLEKTAAQSEADANDDDTLLRIEPGATVDINGEINLGADVFNANLSQLATWVPALRGPNNAPTLRGNLTEFSLRLSGKTKAPDVIGSIQAEELLFNSYTIDRLRVARFEVMDGQFKIAPGNLTIAKGAYQSSAASGSVNWDWARGGPVTDGPINVKFPIQTSDFAALAGLFVPALSEVGADEFSGGVQVVGTLADPKLSGRVTLKDARFSLEGPQVAVPVGLKNVSGTIRFTPDERIEIDADDPLRGTLASAASIKAPATKEKNKKAPRVTTPPVILAGDWKLRGGIGLDLSAESISNPVRAIGRQKYDLAFSVKNAAVGSPQLAGAHEGDAALLFVTDDDGAQNLRWMIAARGRRKNKQSKGGGEMVSIGSLRLRDDFASGTPALLRSTALEFGTADDFQDYEVAKRINLVSLPDRRPQIKLDKFEWNYTGVGSGQVEGRVVLDNRDAIQQAPREAVELRNARTPTLKESLKKRRTSRNPQLQTRILSAAQLRPIPFEAPVLEGAPLRVGGQLTLQNATLVGAPAGGDGVVTRLSLFPDAPRFDVRLILGDKVEFITAAFRTGLEGELVASGTPSNPQLLGTVRTRNGQVRFPNARARVTEGRVTVAITRDPATDLLRTRVDVDATATGRAGQYLITLALNGPLDLSGEGQNLKNLRVDVTSNPPLSQSEAFAQLLGTAPRDNGDFSSNEANQAYAGAVLQVLSAPLFSGVERSVAQALGLDSVSFEYRFDEPLSVQFAKALNDRVFVTYRRSFGASSNRDAVAGSGRTPFELSIEYQLRGNLRLGLKTDESRITTLTLGKTFRF